MSVFVAVVCPGKAFVNVVAIEAVASISDVAFAFEGAFGVGAVGIAVARCHRHTFVDVFAFDKAVAVPPDVAIAHKGAESVCTCRVGHARLAYAFVHVGTVHSVSVEPDITGTCEAAVNVCASGVGIAIV